jgi:mannosyltransferase OCH1-like enzyme
MIPKKIYQTHKNYELSDNLKKLIQLMININHDFEYTFMDNKECLEFIKENFDDDFVQMYEALPLDIMRSDVWRVAVVYINGGVYCDTDVVCEKNLSELIKNKELVAFKEKTEGTSNFFFASHQKHPVLQKVLDLMLKNYQKAFDLNEPMIVQNFGMALFDEVIKDYKGDIEYIGYGESLEWVKHLWFGSWRESEHNYRDSSKNNKPITFFTTFHKNGYDVYGKEWIHSFITNVANQRNNIFARIYVEGLPNLRVNHPQVELIDFKDAIPEHKKWKYDFLKRSPHSDYIKNLVIRFSHKGFVMQHALDNIMEGYAIWLDADCIYEDSKLGDFPSNFFKNGESLACQVEDLNHVESGIIIFDVENPKLEKYKSKFKSIYSIEDIMNFTEPYDGFVVRKSLYQSEVKYYDLNKDFGIGGVQSDPTQTFLHPEIKKRFTHNIGISGKRKYEDWIIVSKKDNIFNILENSGFKPLSKEQRHIRTLRSKRKKKNK